VDNATVGYTNDDLGQLTSATGKDPNGTPRANEQLTYTYDPARNLLTRNNNTLNQGSQTDNADKLTNVFLNNNVLTVAGSLSNTVTSLTLNGQAATVYHDLAWAVPGGVPLTNAVNPLTAVVTIGGLTMTNSLVALLPATVTLSYDADGNLTWDGLLAYTYDGADELTAVIFPSAWKTGYVYDGLGRRRIRKDYMWTNSAWAETNEVHYVYDGMKVIQERNSNNVPLVTYTRGVDFSGTSQGAGGIGGLLARTDANGSAYYHTDGNGNVTALVNGSGAVVAKYLYDSFGNTLGMWGQLAAGNTYRFSSKEVDARSGQYYYGFRWYDPNLQRWLNQDPIQEAGGINLYRYVGNSPINRVDPLGLFVSADPNDANTVAQSFAGSAFSTWAAGTFESGTLTALWATGLGPNTYNFGPNDPMTQLMMGDPGVQKAIDAYTAKNTKKSPCKDPSQYTPLTDYGIGFGLQGLYNAGLNPARQFVGSYDVSIYPNGPDSISISLWNRTSFTSAFYGVGPSWSRSTFGPGGNMDQTYTWTQKYP